MRPEIKYSLAWIVLPFIAILNGMIREFVYRDFTGNFIAHQISTLTLILLIALYVRLLNDKIELHSKSSAFVVGFVWLALTVAFEFFLGLVIMGNSIHAMLDDYDIFKGNLWSLVLLWVFFAPYLLRKKKTISYHKI